MTKQERNEVRENINLAIEIYERNKILNLPLERVFVLICNLLDALDEADKEILELTKKWAEADGDCRYCSHKKILAELREEIEEFSTKADEFSARAMAIWEDC